MSQEQSERSPLTQGAFEQLIGGFVGEPKKSDMDILRTKLMKRHDVMVRESNDLKTLETLVFKQHAIIQHLHTILETYGWGFSD